MFIRSYVLIFRGKKTGSRKQQKETFLISILPFRLHENARKLDTISLKYMARNNYLIKSEKKLESFFFSQLES